MGIRLQLILHLAFVWRLPLLVQQRALAQCGGAPAAAWTKRPKRIVALHRGGTSCAV